MNINGKYPCHSSNYRKQRRDSIKYIVIHYVGATGGAKENAVYYSTRADIGASAHYFVGHASEEGGIYQSVADESCAWHCGSESGIYYSDCRNDSSIGIEMCCHFDGSGWYFDDITVENTAKLVRELMKKYSIPIGNVLRHYDVTHKRCPAPYVKDETLWNDFIRRVLSVTEPAELTTVNDIVWELSERGIISDKALWLTKLEEDKDAYWLARKALSYIKKGAV